MKLIVETTTWTTTTFKIPNRQNRFDVYTGIPEDSPTTTMRQHNTRPNNHTTLNNISTILLNNPKQSQQAFLLPSNEPRAMMSSPYSFYTPTKTTSQTTRDYEKQPEQDTDHLPSQSLSLQPRSDYDYGSPIPQPKTHPNYPPLSQIMTSPINPNKQFDWYAINFNDTWCIIHAIFNHTHTHTHTHTQLE